MINEKSLYFVGHYYIRITVQKTLYIYIYIHIHIHVDVSIESAQYILYNSTSRSHRLKSHT